MFPRVQNPAPLIAFANLYTFDCRERKEARKRNEQQRTFHPRIPRSAHFRECSQSCGPARAIMNGTTGGGEVERSGGSQVSRLRRVTSGYSSWCRGSRSSEACQQWRACRGQTLELRWAAGEPKALRAL
jgi:hypothetical protein